MLETIPLALATPIAKIVLDKLYEGVGSKLGEKVVEAAATPIEKLGQRVWDRWLKYKPGAEKRLEGAAKGSKADFEELEGELLNEMENPGFLEEVEPIAQEIHQVIVRMNDVQAQNLQNIAGDGYQNNHTQGPILQGVNNSPITFNNYYDGSKPKD